MFLNTKGKKGDVSEELKAFLSFVEKSTVQNAEAVNDSYVAQLSAKIEDIKRDEELGGAFMTLEEKMEELARDKMEEGKIEGKIEGILEEKVNIAKTMKAEGFSLEQIAKITNLPIEEIKEL